MIRKFISITKEKCLIKIKNFISDSKGMGTIEMVLLILDNPFTSSTYILSY